MLNLKPNNYICTLDIGSSKLAACLVKLKKNKPESIFFDTQPSKGIKEGVIVDSIELVSCISKLLKNLRAKSGVNFKYVSANISGKDIFTKYIRAIMPLAERGNKVITLSDVQNVNEQARVLGSSLEEEIIHIIPSGYTIDSKTNILNPLGLYSHKLEVELYLVCVKLSHVQSLSRAISQAGYEIKDLFFSGLATYRAVFDKELSQGINLLCDIGKDTTELLVFKEGVLKDIEILPLGGDNLTLQLHDVLKIPFELAEDLKRSHGIIGDSGQISEDKEILVKKSNIYKPIKQKLAAEIVTSSAKLVCSQIKEAVAKKVSSHQVNNFVVTGRAILIEGFIETLENTLSIPVKLGRVTNPAINSLIRQDGSLSGQKYLVYLTCLGMACEALQGKAVLLSPNQQSSKNIVSRAINRFKEVYQEYF